jgi:hypothetical protein
VNVAAAGAGNGEAAVAGGPTAIIEARCVVKSFGQTPALRGDRGGDGPERVR